MKRPFRTISEINVTNLVDVTMVLLIVFMLTTPLLQSGIDVDLPKTEAALLKDTEFILVSLTKDQRLFIDDEEIPDAGFTEVLIRRYETLGKKPVVLKADKEIPYGSVVRIMGQIRSAGIGNIGLMVEPEES